MGTDHDLGRTGSPDRADGLTLAKLRSIQAHLRRAAHSGETHRVDKLSAAFGNYFGMQRWAAVGDENELAWFMSCACFDFGHCIDAPERIPAGSMVSFRQVPQQNMVMREPT